jgi:magnesium transporter
MPEGIVTHASLTQARQLLATGSFVVVDIELPEGPTPDDQGVAYQLGLDAERLSWLGRLAEDVRAEHDGETASFVAPLVEGDRVIHVHAVATDRYLVAAHRGSVELIATLVGRVPHDRPSDPAATLFLLLEGAVATFRRLAHRVVQEVKDLEDEMFEHRQPQHLRRLVLLRRRLVALHRTVQPYAEEVEQLVTLMAVRHDVSDERKALVQAHDRDVKVLLATIESLQDTVQHAVDSYSSLVATEQNGVINKLTILSAIFLPLSYLTGFFGMSFAYLVQAQEGRAAFWLLGVGLQIVSLAVALYLVNRMGLWRMVGGDSVPAPKESDLKSEA